MTDLSSGVAMDYGISESVGTHKPTDDRLRSAVGILMGVVIAVPFWAVIGWVVYLLEK